MATRPKYQTLEESILLLQKEGKREALSIKEILRVLSGKGRSMIVLLLCLPFCLPIPIPGLSTPFGLAIAFFGLRIAFGKKAWLPKKVLSKKIPPRYLAKITKMTLFVVKKIKRLIHPRLNWICHSRPMEVVNGIAIVFLGLILALPLPIPFSNLTAAWAIFLISLGMIEDDGLFVLIGHFITLMIITFFVVMGFSLKHML